MENSDQENMHAHIGGQGVYDKDSWSMFTPIHSQNTSATWKLSKYKMFLKK